MRISARPSYALGCGPEGCESAANKQRAEAAIRQMRRSLRAWLKYRDRMDDYVAGKIEPPALFRRAKPLPRAVVAATLRDDRRVGEQDLANTLHALLVEMGCPSGVLPSTNVAVDPDAAAKLARIAIAGKCPGEAASAQAQGIVWFVLAIPVAAVVLIAGQIIQSKADVQKEKERLRCVQSGACTDSGFWLKMGAIAVTGWLAWDKFGLREAVKKRAKA